MTVRINCWSGPRNVSTALMRSFSQRPDTKVFDEPLYGYYLLETGAPHPGRDELVEVLETDPAVVIDEVIVGPHEANVVFFKQMVHHLLDDLDLSFLDSCQNVLLVRDPAEVIASLVHQLPEPTMRDVGMQRQVELLRYLRERDQEPPVLDARELLLDPEGVLRELCSRLGIEWFPSMLAWEPGPHPDDGAWAPHWYESLYRSTGFAPYKPSEKVVPEECLPLLEECRVLYDELKASAIVSSKVA
jgi:Sulfotransferase domain